MRVPLGLLAACHAVDGARPSGHASTGIDHDGDGWGAPADCDDDDASIGPNASEQCNGVDDDCDGAVDDNAIDAGTWYVDADSDGYGDVRSPRTACDPPSGTVPDATDCDDAHAEVNPAHAEICGDGLDNDCNPGTEFCGLDDSTTLESDADLELRNDGPPYESFLGFLGSPGDVTGDGDPDFVFGGYPFSEDGPNPIGGTLFVRRGPLTESGPASSGAIDIHDAGCLPGLDRIAGPADLNHDGYDDLWLEPGALDSAVATVFFGPIGPDQLDVSAADVLFASVYDDEGWTIGGASAVAGDVDGDGTPDLVHSRASSSGFVDIWVTLGPINDSTDDRMDFHWVSTAIGQLVAEHDSLAMLGDIDGDGLDDTLIGAQGDMRVQRNGGAAFVVLGPGSDVATIDDADWVLLPSEWDASAPTLLGGSVSEAGDLDGDGLMDLQVGSWGFPYYDNADVRKMPIYLVHGRSEPVGTMTIDDVADATLGGEGGDELDLVGPPGDFDGDGVLDVLATGVFFDASDTGSSFLFRGPLSGSYKQSDARGAFQAPPGSALGFSSLGSDVNADGLADAIFSPLEGTIPTYIVYGGLEP